MSVDAKDSFRFLSKFKKKKSRHDNTLHYSKFSPPPSTKFNSLPRKIDQISLNSRTQTATSAISSSSFSSTDLLDFTLDSALPKFVIKKVMTESRQIQDRGIVRIYFPDSDHKFTNYKSIMANISTNTEHILKSTLDKYNIIESLESYKLFDVVGTVVKLTAKIDDPLIPEEQFIELYSRPMEFNEKPLFVQSLWTPNDGYLRRFELRRVMNKTISLNKAKDLYERSSSIGISSQPTDSGNEDIHYDRDEHEINPVWRNFS